MGRSEPHSLVSTYPFKPMRYRKRLGGAMPSAKEVVGEDACALSAAGRVKSYYSW